MSLSYRRSLLSVGILAALAAPSVVYATNGMNMEGYGPEATGMGGASLAYDNGTAAVMNNPATLGLMGNGDNRFDVALGILKPTVSTSMPGMPNADSAGDQYLMPAAGWVQKSNGFTYGVAMFSQGGMGTEYDKNSFLAAGTGEAVRSEVGVGRLVAPLAFQVNNQLTLGGSLDFVWAGMDLKMAMAGQQFNDFMPGSTNMAGTAAGSMVTGMGQAIQFGMLNQANPVNTVRFDFSNSSDYTGEAVGNGFAAKLGLTFKVSNNITLGATYHSETSMSDLETGNASMSMNANFDDNLLNGSWQPMAGTGSPANTYTPVDVPVSGKVSVVNFQWPASLGVGAAFQLNESVLIAADIKQLYWSNVMDSFRMKFTADSTQSNPLAAGYAGTSMDLEMYQKWDDQTIFQLGGAFRIGPAFTIRAGLNFSSNPVPNDYLNPLFPAVVENHYTTGFTLDLNKASSLSASMAIAPEVKVTSTAGVTSSHAQTNFQIMYSHRL